MATERIVGIDFGTSTSVIRVKRYKDGKPVGGDKLSTESVIFNGSYPTVPTLIQRAGENTYYGYDAQIPKKKAVLHQGFKVNLESADPKRKEEARALTQEFLTYLAGVYKAQSDGGHLGETGDRVRTIISYPVKWSDETKAFMVEAAKKAGFLNVEGMDEAQAAIHAVTLQSEDYLKKQGYLKQGVPCTMLLIDMGAGTTDLVLCRYTPGEHPKTEALATWPTKGDALFGGQEVEQLLTTYVKGKLPEEEAPMILKRCGRDKFKTWKETVVSPALSNGETVESFSDLDMIVELLDLDMDPYDLSRSTFEESADGYLKQFPELVRGCIGAAGIKGEEVELVILTGGHSQWYFVKELLAGEKPELCEMLLPMISQDKGRVIPITRPQETVALGLAYLPLSAKLEREKTPVRKEEKKPEEKKTASDEKKDKGVSLPVQRKAPRMFIRPIEQCRGFKIVAMDIKGTIHRANVTDSKDGLLESESMGMNQLTLWERGKLFGDRNPDYVGEAVKWVRGLYAGELCFKGLERWTDIVSVAGEDLKNKRRVPFGLRKDGTVVTIEVYNTGAKGEILGQYNEWLTDFLKSWKDIVSIRYENNWLIGWEKNGGVLMARDVFSATGRTYRVPQATAVITRYIYPGAVLKKDGTVELCGDPNASNFKDVTAANHWSDIEEIHAVPGCIVGLRRDGTVVVSSDRYKQETAGWKNIVSIEGNKFGIIGLKKDGTVVATGILSELTKGWKSIAEIYSEVHSHFANEEVCVAGVMKNGQVIYSCYFEERTATSLFSKKPASKRKTNSVLLWNLPPLEEKLETPLPGLSFNLGDGYFLRYEQRKNDYGYCCDVNAYLCKENRYICQITDENGCFLDFPGTEHGDWEKDLKGPFTARTKFTIGYNGFDEDGLAEFIWLVQPDGMYWADEDGFGAENDREIHLRAKFDKMGRFVTPFYEKKEE